MMKHNFNIYLTRRTRMKVVGFILAVICVLSLFVAAIAGKI